MGSPERHDIRHRACKMTLVFLTRRRRSDLRQLCRCWIVYAGFRKRWCIVALPFLLWLGATACAAMDIVLLSTLHLFASIPTTMELRPYLTAYYVLTLTLNALTTGMLNNILHEVSASLVPTMLRSDCISYMGPTPSDHWKCSLQEPPGRRGSGQNRGSCLHRVRAALHRCRRDQRYCRASKNQCILQYN